MNTKPSIRSVSWDGRPVHTKPSLFCWDPVSHWGRYSAVDVTTRLRDEQSRDRGLNPGSHKWFSLLRSVQPGSSDHPALYSCYLRVLSARIKRPNCGAEHSSPTSTKIKNKWSYTSTPTYAFLACTWTSLPYHLNITLLYTPLSSNLSLSFIRSHRNPTDTSLPVTTWKW